MSAAQAIREGRWLIIAPHPDDETLGPGALIAALAAAGNAPAIAFTTDGAGSHTDAPGWPPTRIANLRRAEARHALIALGCRQPPLHLNWPDAAPPAPGDPRYEAGLRRLMALCRRQRIARILATWQDDPHCDHEAAATLAAAVARRCHIPFSRYPVWGWTRADLVERVRPCRIMTLDTAAHRPAQRRAMACHRSQCGGRIVGGDSFRLPRAMLRLIDRPFTLLMEPRHAP